MSFALLKSGSGQRSKGTHRVGMFSAMFLFGNDRVQQVQMKSLRSNESDSAALLSQQRINQSIIWVCVCVCVYEEELILFQKEDFFFLEILSFTQQV